MVNLGLLAVAERLLVRGGRGVRIRLDLDLEDRRVEALGRAERGDDDGRLERLGGGEKLDGKVLVRLEAARVSSSSTTRRSTSPYNLNSGPASLLDCQREGRFKARLWLLQHQERLVRPLRLAIVLGRQEQLQRVGGSEGDGFRERGLLAKPAR